MSSPEEIERWLRGLPFEREWTLKAVLASGPGGQNVNKVNTAVELYFDLRGTGLLEDWQKARALESLANRVNQEGILRVASSEHRSQGKNREECIEKFFLLLAKGIYRPAKRKRVRVPQAVKMKRLQHKRHRSEIKGSRRKPGASDS